MKVARILIIAITLAMFLSGCRSRKHTIPLQGSKVEYSAEEFDAMGKDLVAEARKWLGTPYRYGGDSRRGTDCSGMMMSIYGTVCNVKLPRTTVEQKAYCTKVARNKARIGDLMFFGSGKRISHVGMYIGSGNMIHASSSQGVMISNVDDGYWGNCFRSVGRVESAYESWVSTSRGERALKQNKNESVDHNKLYEMDSNENESRDVRHNEGNQPVIIGEIPYNKLPSGSSEPESVECEEPEMCEPDSEAAKGVSNVKGGRTGKGKSANNKRRSKPEQSAKKAGPQQTSTEAETEIELLDVIINEKVDSIFNTRFMD